jgi:hypothetical protein
MIISLKHFSPKRTAGGSLRGLTSNDPPVDYTPCSLVKNTDQSSATATATLMSSLRPRDIGGRSHLTWNGLARMLLARTLGGFAGVHDPLDRGALVLFRCGSRLPGTELVGACGGCLRFALGVALGVGHGALLSWQHERTGCYLKCYSFLFSCQTKRRIVEACPRTIRQCFRDLALCIG